MDFSQLLADFLPTSGGLLVIRTIAAATLIFLVPGLAWTFVFFQKLNALERTVLSIGLSIAMVTLSVTILNILFDVRINGLNTVYTIIVITIVPLAIYFIRKYRTKQAGAIDKD